MADTKFWQHVGEAAAVADGWLLESISYFKICLVDPNKSMPIDSEEWWPAAAEVAVSSKWLLESKELFWTVENPPRQEHGHKTKKLWLPMATTMSSGGEWLLESRILLKLKVVFLDKSLAMKQKGLWLVVAAVASGSGWLLESNDKFWTEFSELRWERGHDAERAGCLKQQQQQQELQAVGDSCNQRSHLNRC